MGKGGYVGEGKTMYIAPSAGERGEESPARQEEWPTFCVVQQHR